MTSSCRHGPLIAAEGYLVCVLGCAIKVRVAAPRRRTARKPGRRTHNTAPTSAASYGGLKHLDTQGQYRAILAALDAHPEGLTRRELAQLTGVGYEAVCGRVNEQIEVDVLAELTTTRKNKDTGIQAAVVVRATRLPEIEARLL